MNKRRKPGYLNVIIRVQLFIQSLDLFIGNILQERKSDKLTFHLGYWINILLSKDD